ncbi:hypothetical protein BDV41DRAFT_559216 [Aspergillus transmontanensis]|uniref:Secreted protein n=1 Tax=Aspergillus transmontanensis TaxID=1034304 RepID=A0A5N6VD98_9EURO|nr:hypothetical protein BDV41DRAFT_559216 [Aspergillus transmontanensis]
MLGYFSMAVILLCGFTATEVKASRCWQLREEEIAGFRRYFPIYCLFPRLYSSADLSRCANYNAKGFGRLVGLGTLMLGRHWLHRETVDRL